MHDDDPDAKEREEGVSRRTFLKASGIPLAAAPVLIGPRMVQAADAEVAVHGPGKAKFTLNVNGQARPGGGGAARHAARRAAQRPRRHRRQARLRPRHLRRLHDARGRQARLRLLDARHRRAGREDHDRRVAGRQPRSHPLQQAFVDHDAQQCGFCTPGFVMACKAFLDKNPKPTRADVEKGLGGNLCRCGTYVGIREAVLAQGGTRG